VTDDPLAAAPNLEAGWALDVDHRANGVECCAVCGFAMLMVVGRGYHYTDAALADVEAWLAGRANG
jgi:hypothetical protein